MQGALFRDLGGVNDHQERGVFVSAIGGTVTFEDSAGPAQSVAVTGNESDGVVVADGGTTGAFTSGSYSNNGGDGTTTDLTRYPARRGSDDIVILCADPTLDLAWSAVTFPAQGYVWFALRDPRKLASTLLWFSNGGRQFPPWNGRHVNVMGIEDITAFFHVGLAPSCKPNSLTERGIRTCLEPDARGGLSIPYIQGVARIPQGFDRVTAIEPLRGGLVLTADSGAVVETPCEIDFLHTGTLGGLDFP